MTSRSHSAYRPCPVLRPLRARRPLWWGSGATAASVLLWAGGAAGQEAPSAFTPASGFLTNTASAPRLGTSQLASPPEAGPSSEATPLQLGPVDFHPHLLYRLSYGDGLLAEPGQKTTTVINELAPGILLGLGDHWSLDYTPTLRYYSSKRFQDGVDQSVVLNGNTSYEAWSFGFSQRYDATSQPLVETASQLGQESYNTALNANWLINSELSLELGLDQSLVFVDNVGNPTPFSSFQDSRQWSTTDWLNYQFWPRLGIAVGGGLGYVNIPGSSDMLFEQAQGRVTWTATDKLAFTLSGGGDIRQFLESPVPTMINPIFSLAAQYQPFEVTTLSLVGSRSVNASYFQAQLTENTTLSATLSQRLLRNFYASLGVGYTTVSYQSTAVEMGSLRADDYTFVNVRLSSSFLRRATGAVFYQYSENTSNNAGYSYSSSMVGLELAYRF